MTEPRDYRICANCVMDTSDAEIAFDERGVCVYCRDYVAVAMRKVPPAEQRDAQLRALAGEIRAAGEGKPYDCLLGLSGGVDSSYVALVAKRLGLRPLAVHLDNGWNSEAAVRNVERLLRGLDLELETHVVDWAEFRRLQLAFLRAGVPDIELLTDHAITALLHRLARSLGLRYIVSGNNYATEFGMPPSWTHRKSDLRNLRAIARAHGAMPIRSLPTASTLALLRDQYVRRIQVVGLLNYVHYDKAAAMDELVREVGWEYYGGKHHESVFTRFYQAHILPTKFGIDKRRVHLSALINSGQLTRDAALAELEAPPYDPVQLATDKHFVAKKWGLTGQELDELLREPGRSHFEYPSDETYIRPLLNVKAGLRRLGVVP